MRERIGAGPEAVDEGRLWLLVLGIVLVFAVFLGRLFQLQLIQGDDLQQRSQRNSIRTVRIEAPRGEILDREGRVLATTRPAFHLQVMPSELRSPEATLAALAQLLEDDPGRLRERVGERRGRERFQPVRLAADLPFERVARVESHRFALPGVVTDVRPRREYVEGDLAAHLLGSIGEVRADQLERKEFEGYRSGETVGQTGIEATLESALRGRAGGRNVVVDVAGREVESLDEVDPVAGATAVLTLDLDLQRAAVEGFRDVPEGEPEKLGALVALDPRTGDVLALVSRPAFDPNSFAGGIDPVTWRALTSHELKPLQNRALSGQYPPGSTYKAFVAAAALEDGVITPTTRVFCPGSFSFGRRSYRCWKKEGHGSVDVHAALVRSCDVFFYQVGIKLGIDRIAFFSEALGLGHRTGIPLPDEKPGLIPTMGWKQRRFGERWMPGETVSASIGQGYNLVTPLQLAVAYAAIANGGWVVKPRLVQRIASSGGTETTAGPPERRERAPISEQTLAVVRAGLVGVVQEAGGTGGRARVPGVTVAGKTGTSQVVRLEHFEGVPESRIPLKYRDHAWFAAFAPAEAPEIVVAVLSEHGGHGGSAAAPIAQRVLQRYFEKRGLVVPPAPERAPTLQQAAAAAAGDADGAD